MKTDFKVKSNKAKCTFIDFANGYESAKEENKIEEFFEKWEFCEVKNSDEAVSIDENLTIWENEYVYLILDKRVGTPAQYSKTDFTLVEALKNEKEQYEQ